MAKLEMILSLGAEKESITLYGVKLEQDWYFLLQTKESPRLQVEYIGDPLNDKNTQQMGFHNAIRLLDTYPWHHFIPRSVHPYFAKRFLSEVVKRIQPGHIKLSFWRRLVEYYQLDEIVH